MASYASRRLKYLWSCGDNGLTYQRHLLSRDAATLFLYSPPERFQLSDFTIFSLSRSQRRIHHLDITFYGIQDISFFFSQQCKYLWIDLFRKIGSHQLRCVCNILSNNLNFVRLLYDLRKRHYACRRIHVSICLPPFCEWVDLISTFCGLSPPIDSHLLVAPSRADRKGHVRSHGHYAPSSSG